VDQNAQEFDRAIAAINAGNSTFVADDKAAIPAAAGYLNWQSSRMS
jgi:hypothetical protein